MILLVGCQSQRASEGLPPPTFGGAVISPPGRAMVPAPKPAVPVPDPHASKPSPPVAGVPREWVPLAKAERRQWSWIVIHHSATPAGGAKTFDKMHRNKGWDELGYHFVIGNGTDTKDGQIEVGSRWPAQKWGAHTKTPDNRYNDHGIGICLVGNFDIDRPTTAQLRSLAKLVAYLEKTYNIPSDRVIGHRDAKPTECPGNNTSIAVVRRMAKEVLAESGSAAPEGPTRLAGEGSLLKDAR